ncbi:MAG: hypothetical protein Kow0068_26640 [Marinilabiliales bacterium]
MNIKYLHNQEIDYKKWNWCINKAFNSIIYTYSWYLDIVSPGWDALVADDYRIVMPLTHKTKYGIKLLMQPLLTQQLGVFSINNLNPAIVNEFVKKACEKFRYININLNKLNNFELEDFQVNKRVTYELDLILPYNKLKNNYSSNHKRNINKAIKNKISVSSDVNTNQLITLIKNNLENKISQLNEDRYNDIRKIISYALRYQIGEIYGAYNPDNELLAAAFFIVHPGKCIFLFGASSKEGKEKSAMFAIFDHFIEKYSEKILILDFEGSELPGLARFYSGFGAKPFYYLNIKKNALPWYIRYFKK